MADRITPTFKQKRFAQKYVQNGGNGARAALEVYDTKKGDAHVIAYQNLQKPIVRAEIEKCLKESGLTLDYLTNTTRDAISTNLEGKPSQAVAADLIKFVYKLHNVIPASKSMQMSVSRREEITSKDFTQVLDELKKLNETTNKLLEDSK